MQRLDAFICCVIWAVQRQLWLVCRSQETVAICGRCLAAYAQDWHGICYENVCLGLIRDRDVRIGMPSPPSISICSIRS